MKTITKRTLLVAFSLVMLLFCLTGCINSGTNLAIHRDGKIDYSVNYRMNYAAVADAFGGDADQAKEFVNQTLDGIKANIASVDLNADYTDTGDDEFGGLQFTIHFASVDDMNKTLTEINEQGESAGEGKIGDVLEQVPGYADENRTTAITATMEATPNVGNGDSSIIHMYSGHHLFYDTYQVKGEMTIDNINYMGETLEGLGKPADQSASEFLGQDDLYEIDFSVSVPMTAFGTKQNANSAEKRTYHWNANAKTDQVVVDFTTNVPTILGLILIGILALLIVAGIVVLIIVLLKKSKKKSALEDTEGSELLDSAEAEFYGSDNDVVVDAEEENNVEVEVPEIEAESLDVPTESQVTLEDDAEQEDTEESQDSETE